MTIDYSGYEKRLCELALAPYVKRFEEIEVRGRYFWYEARLAELRYNHNHGSDGRFISCVNLLDNSGVSGIIEIGKSVGAKAKNYPVKLPNGNQHTKLAEGQTIVGKAFAGKGTKTEIKDRFRLESDYNIPADK